MSANDDLDPKSGLRSVQSLLWASHRGDEDEMPAGDDLDFQVECSRSGPMPMPVGDDIDPPKKSGV
jgi:hypothetical protein